MWIGGDIPENDIKQVFTSTGNQKVIQNCRSRVCWWEGMRQTRQARHLHIIEMHWHTKSWSFLSLVINNQEILISGDRDCSSWSSWSDLHHQKPGNLWRAKICSLELFMMGQWNRKDTNNWHSSSSSSLSGEFQFRTEATRSFCVKLISTASNVWRNSISCSW